MCALRFLVLGIKSDSFYILKVVHVAVKFFHCK